MATRMELHGTRGASVTFLERERVAVFETEEKTVGRMPFHDLAFVLIKFVNHLMDLELHGSILDSKLGVLPSPQFSRKIEVSDMECASDLKALFWKTSFVFFFIEVIDRKDEKNRVVIDHIDQPVLQFFGNLIERLTKEHLEKVKKEN